MEINVEVQRTTEALDQGDRAGVRSLFRKAWVRGRLDQVRGRMCLHGPIKGLNIEAV